MQYLRIREWRKYQHYKDRNPPWIKLHREMLSSRTWVTLDNDSRVLVFALMMLAPQHDNMVPADPDYLTRVAYLNTPPNLEPILKCQFIDIVDEKGKMLAHASALQADARPETEGEGERETEERREETAGAKPQETEAPALTVCELPTNRKNGDGESVCYPITQAQLDEFSSLYPAVDIRQELKKMRGWLIGSPAKRKTAQGMLRFVNTWLAKEQDRGGSRPSPTTSSWPETPLWKLGDDPAIGLPQDSRQWSAAHWAEYARRSEELEQ